MLLQLAILGCAKRPLEGPVYHDGYNSIFEECSDIKRNLYYTFAESEDEGDEGEDDGYAGIRNVTIPKNERICILGSAIMASDKNFIAKTRFPKNVTTGKPIEWYPETVTTKNPIIQTTKLPDIVYDDSYDNILPISLIQCENQNEECTIQYVTLLYSYLIREVSKEKTKIIAEKSIITTFDESNGSLLTVFEQLTREKEFKMDTVLYLLSEKKHKIHFENLPENYSLENTVNWKPIGDFDKYLSSYAFLLHPANRFEEKTYLNATTTINWSLVDQNTTDRKFFFPKNVRFVTPYKGGVFDLKHAHQQFPYGPKDDPVLPDDGDDKEKDKNKFKLSTMSIILISISAACFVLICVIIALVSVIIFRRKRYDSQTNEVTNQLI